MGNQKQKRKPGALETNQPIKELTDTYHIPVLHIWGGGTF